MCQGALKWLNRLDAGDRLLFAPLQGETAEKYEIDRSLDAMAVAVAEGEGRWRSSEAVRRACLKVGGPGWLLAGVLIIIPLFLREWGYRLVARNRKRFFQSGSCSFPEQGMREKMLG